MEPIQQPTQEPAVTATPVSSPTPVAQPQQPAQQNPTTNTSKGLAITSLVLGIVSILLAIFWFISIPLAITAIVLGIVSLVKKHAGKGMSITGLATGGVTLFILIPLVFITVIAYNGIAERALQSEQDSRQQKIEQQLFN